MPAAKMYSVTLCGGTVADRRPLSDMLTSTWRVMPAEAEDSLQTCTAEAAVKLPSCTAIGASAPDSSLLMTTRVSAESAERVAAKADSVSGSGTLVETLTSPKVDFAPS